MLGTYWRNMKKKFTFVLLVVTLATLISANTATAEPVSPQNAIGTWSQINYDDFSPRFTNGQGNISSLQYFDNQFWAFGTNSYGDAVFLKSADQNAPWVDAKPGGLTGSVDASASEIIDGKLYVTTQGSSANDARLWIYTPNLGWDEDTTFPTMNYIIDISAWVGESNKSICVSGYAVSGASIWCNFDGDNWVERPLTGISNPSFEFNAANLIVNDTDVYAIIDAFDGDQQSALYSWNTTQWIPKVDTELTGTSKWKALASNGLGAVIIKEDSNTSTVTPYTVDLTSGELSLFGLPNFGATGTFSDVQSLHIYQQAITMTLKHDGKGQIWVYAIGNDGWVPFSDPGEFTYSESVEADTVDDVIFSGFTLFASTSYDGEGSFFPSTWFLTFNNEEEPTSTTTTTMPETTDTDLDGVLDALEAGAPNSGDGNGDGTADKNQNNVSSLLGSDGKYVTVMSPEGTQLSAVSNTPESAQDAQDKKYQYQFGLTTFTVSGVAPGATITMNLYFDSKDDVKKFVARKLIGKEYANLDGASILNVVVGTSTPAIKLTYSIKDNGPLDTNATAGVITDPVGLGSIGNLPATGSNSSDLATQAIMILMSGIVIVAIAIRRKRIISRA